MSSKYGSRLAPKVLPTVDLSGAQMFASSMNNNSPGPFNNSYESEESPRGCKVMRKECICERPGQIVMCQVCGNTVNGRARLQCQAHPLVTFLIDLVACPRCKAPVTALREFEKPHINPPQPHNSKLTPSSSSMTRPAVRPTSRRRPEYNVKRRAEANNDLQYMDYEY